ncbi:MAG: YqhA family protein, partial [Candidatus Margulisiibacteriota bacterium]
MEKEIVKHNSIERIFENILWNCRFIVILAVIFSVLGSFMLFIIASIDMLKVAILAFNNYVFGLEIVHFNEKILQYIVGSIDLYLIGVVVLIFSFGIYELFLSKIDVAKVEKTSNVLEIHSLDELKNKIIKVIIMVLIVTFFKRILETHFQTPLELFYLALSIFALCFGLYFLNKE